MRDSITASIVLSRPILRPSDGSNTALFATNLILFPFRCLYLTSNRKLAVACASMTACGWTWASLCKNTYRSGGSSLRRPVLWKSRKGGRLKVTAMTRRTLRRPHWQQSRQFMGKQAMCLSWSTAPCQPRGAFP